jgi:anti-sigma regulatory factor (Ser/Thr protein kinase)
MRDPVHRWNRSVGLKREVILPASPHAPAVARAALFGVIPPPILEARDEDARLVISELVTNAVKYGAGEGPDSIRMVIEADDSKVRVEIDQTLPVPDLHPVDPRLEGDHPGGWGLRITEALADEWGSEAGPPGRVWFEFRA